MGMDKYIHWNEYRDRIITKYEKESALADHRASSSTNMEFSP